MLVLVVLPIVFVSKCDPSNEVKIRTEGSAFRTVRHVKVKLKMSYVGVGCPRDKLSSLGNTNRE